MSLLKFLADIFNSIFPIREEPVSPREIVTKFLQLCYEESTIKAKAIHHAFSFDSKEENDRLAIIMKNALDTHFAQLATQSMNDSFLSNIQQNPLNLKLDIISTAIEYLLQDMPHFTLVDTDDSSCFEIALNTTQDMYDIDTSHFLTPATNKNTTTLDAATTLSHIRSNLDKNNLIATGFALKHGYLLAIVPKKNEIDINNLQLTHKLDFSIYRFLNKLYYENLTDIKKSSNSIERHEQNHNACIDFSLEDTNTTSQNHEQININKDNSDEAAQVNLTRLTSEFVHSELYFTLVENLDTLSPLLAVNPSEVSLFEDAIRQLKEDYLFSVEQDLYFKLINSDSKIPILSGKNTNIDFLTQQSEYFAQTTFTLGMLFERLPFSFQTELPFCSTIAENILDRLGKTLLPEQTNILELLADSEMNEYSEDLDDDLNQKSSILKSILDSLNLSVLAIENGSDDLSLMIINKDNLHKAIFQLKNLLITPTVIYEYF